MAPSPNTSGLLDWTFMSRFFLNFCPTQLTSPNCLRRCFTLRVYFILSIHRLNIRNKFCSGSSKRAVFSIEHKYLSHPISFVTFRFTLSLITLLHLHQPPNTSSNTGFLSLDGTNLTTTQKSPLFLLQLIVHQLGIFVECSSIDSTLSSLVD